MVSKAYQFGLLLVVFGGFVSLSRGQFGGTSSLVGELGLIVLFVGVLVGAFGIAVPAED